MHIIFSNKVVSDYNDSVSKLYDYWSLPLCWQNTIRLQYYFYSIFSYIRIFFGSKVYGRIVCDSLSNRRVVLVTLFRKDDAEVLTEWEARNKIKTCSSWLILERLNRLWLRTSNRSTKIRNKNLHLT